MATRNAVTGKLKLVVIYTDENDKEKQRQLIFTGLKPGTEPQKILNAANALSGLQADSLYRVLENVESEVI